MPIADCRFDGLKIDGLKIDGLKIGGLKIDGLSNSDCRVPPIVNAPDNRHFNRQSTFGNPLIPNRQSPIANG